MTAPGIRNNNPGNLRPAALPWNGQTGSTDGFCTFDSPASGLRALGKNLLAYYDHHGLVTIRGIIGRWAPAAENDTASYIADVCQQTGFGPDDWLHLHEPSVLGAVMRAIVKHENGEQPYSDAEIDYAVARALA